jgi:hypothetical protein
MQKSTLKESGKQRTCLIKGVAKKNYPKKQKGLFLPAGGVYNSNYSFAPYFFEIRRIYAVCTPYNKYLSISDTENTVRRYALPPLVLYDVYTVPYHTYNYTYTDLANPTHRGLERYTTHLLYLASFIQPGPRSRPVQP